MGLTVPKCVMNTHFQKKKKLTLGQLVLFLILFLLARANRSNRLQWDGLMDILRNSPEQPSDSLAKSASCKDPILPQLGLPKKEERGWLGPNGTLVAGKQRSHLEKKNGGKVNLTAYIFVSRALQPRPYYNQPHWSHSIFYTDVSYSLDQVIIRKDC